VLRGLGLFTGTAQTRYDFTLADHNPANATHGFSFNRNLTAGSHTVSVRVGSWYAASSPTSIFCSSSAGPALPTRWIGTNYHPRNSAWWRMLKDWNTVRSGVLTDLDVLSANGFNLVELYLEYGNWAGWCFCHGIEA
jgi:hypothetical protein